MLQRNPSSNGEKSSASHLGAACPQRSWVMANFVFKLIYGIETFYCLGQILHVSTECLQLRWPLCVSARGCTFFSQTLYFTQVWLCVDLGFALLLAIHGSALVLICGSKKQKNNSVKLLTWEVKLCRKVRFFSSLVWQEWN